MAKMTYYIDRKGNMKITKDGKVIKTIPDCGNKTVEEQNEIYLDACYEMGLEMEYEE